MRFLFLALCVLYSTRMGAQGTENSIAAATYFLLFLGGFILLSAVIGVLYLVRRSAILRYVSMILNAMSLALILYMVVVGTGDRLPGIFLLIPGIFIVLALLIKPRKKRRDQPVSP